jgi:hypothetical protein
MKLKITSFTPLAKPGYKALKEIFNGLCESLINIESEDKFAFIQEAKEIKHLLYFYYKSKSGEFAEKSALKNIAEASKQLVSNLEDHKQAKQRAELLLAATKNLLKKDTPESPAKEK